MRNNSIQHDEDDADVSDSLTLKEKAAIKRIKKVAVTWPKSLWLFSNNGSLEIHKVKNGAEINDNTCVGELYEINNDGGDRD